MLKIKNNKFNGVEYKPRFNSLNQFYGRALKLKRKYKEYEDRLVDDSLMKDLVNEMKDGIVNGDMESVLLKADGEYLQKVKELTEQRINCAQWFLTMDLEGNYSVTNAEELCEVMFENCDINHSQDRNADEFAEYMDFVNSLLNDFFLNFKEPMTTRKAPTTENKSTEQVTN